MEPIIVHSGSDEINRWLNNIGKNIQYIEDFELQMKKLWKLLKWYWVK